MAAAEEIGLSAEQHEARAQGIGGSEAPIIVGVSERMTALELWLLKRGEFEQVDDPDDVLAWLGHQAEPILARWYTQRTGHKVRRCNRTLYHPDHDWMLGHIDRDVVGQPGMLEFKMRVHATGWGPDDSDEIPDDVRVQVQHYLAVTGYDWCDVVVLIGGREFRCYRIERDAGVISALIDAEQEFWLGVQLGTPPELDHEHATAVGLMKAMYPDSNGQVIELGADEAFWAQAMVAAEAKVSEWSRVRDTARAHLLEQLGEAAIGLLPGSATIRRRVYASGSIRLLYSGEKVTP